MSCCVKGLAPNKVWARVARMAAGNSTPIVEKA